MENIYDELIQVIRKIDTKDLSDDAGVASSRIAEEQKVYFWIRLYLKEEMEDILPGDDFLITYSESGECLLTKFVAFGKKNLNRDLDQVIINYDPEDEKKTLCLMVDEESIKTSNEIPFIRTLFKTSKYFEYQVYRRSDLTFTNIRTGVSCEYIDADF